ncbi:Rpn family recombination-promoting nuclease/putative transposase [Sporomusa sphaeroides]|uniref:Rpn family recombination-promoting nuclease/putative transposase n=1 Tax=Sporomusa sphaeroides TaxID=47679 RepID=UPI002B5A2316|nr:Rpn family recombination-promoting nuclease/putative transposase [Sporomusa sphaeroides]HML34242.1 Rpn family recombination-promoting nuclease/putative transposase [Sporomusa sphaeroides]
MKRSVNRMNDYVFKRIFGSEENKDILLNFLNAVLNSRSGYELTEIELLDRELDPDFLGDKYARLDILGRTAKGSLINIEVQIVNQYNIEKRTLFYWAKLYQGQLQSGQSHALLKKTVTINVLNFICLPDASRYHNTYHVREDETHQVLNDDLEIHFLELPKLLCRTSTPQTRLEKWLLYLNNAEGKELEEVLMSEPMIKKALTCEQIFAKSALERRRYELREKAIMEEQTLLHGAREEGRIEGKLEGKLEGAKQTIRTILEIKFGAESAVLMPLLDNITEPDDLTRITQSLLTVTTPREVKDLLGQPD